MRVLSRQGPYDWAYKTVPQNNGAVETLRAGKCLGGSTAINGLAWSKPHTFQIDAMETVGNQGLNWDSLQAYVSPPAERRGMEQRLIAKFFLSGRCSRRKTLRLPATHAVKLDSPMTLHVTPRTARSTLNSTRPSHPRTLNATSTRRSLARLVCRMRRI